MPTLTHLQEYVCYSLTISNYQLHTDAYGHCGKVSLPGLDFLWLSPCKLLANIFSYDLSVYKGVLTLG